MGTWGELPVVDKTFHPVWITEMVFRMAQAVVLQAIEEVDPQRGLPEASFCVFLSGHGGNGLNPLDALLILR